MNLAEIKKHPYTVGALGLLGLFVLYVLLKSRGSSSGVSSLAGLTAQQQQLQAATNLQNQQTAAAEYAASLQAQVQNNQNAAAVQQAYSQNDAALLSTIVQARSADTANQLSADVMNNQNSLEAQVMGKQVDAALKANTNQFDYQTELAKLQAATIQQQLAGKNANDAAIIAAVNKAGLNHGTSSLENSLTAILSEVEQTPSVGTAAEYANAIGAQSSASIWNSIINAISNVGSGVAKGFAL